MIGTKGDWKNIGLAKIIWRLRQDLDVYELINANVKEIQDLGAERSWSGPSFVDRLVKAEL